MKIPRVKVAVDRDVKELKIMTIDILRLPDEKELVALQLMSRDTVRRMMEKEDNQRHFITDENSVSRLQDYLKKHKRKVRSESRIRRTDSIFTDGLPFKMSRSTRKWNKLSDSQKSFRRRLYGTERRKPNKGERVLIGLLDKSFPGEWQYNGNGNFVLEGLHPDFVNIGGKKLIIELFGEYWHRPGVATWSRTEDGRIAIFKKYGYDTLIIWSKELRDLANLEKKVACFVSSNAPDKL